MAKRDGAPIPLSRFGVFVAQLESIAASARLQTPDPVLCFDLLSELVSTIDEEPKEAIIQWQRKCEDALYSLLILGAKRPVRHLASLAMARVIAKGDNISVYSRVSSLQGWLVDGKRGEPRSLSGVAQCLGELYRLFGRKLTSGFAETTSIAAKLMKVNENFVRQDVLQMLHHALEGSVGAGASVAYSEAYRIVMRVGVVDKAFIVRLVAAKCLKSLADIGAPGLGTADLENAASICMKALEDPLPSIRDAFAEALGALLALGMNPDRIKQTRKAATTVKKMDDGVQKYLVSPFIKASGLRAKEIHTGVTLSWVFFLQVSCIKYGLSHDELQHSALQAVDVLQGYSSMEAQSLACVLYIVRVGVIDQMTESAQRCFLVLLGKQLESSGFSPSKGVAILRTLSYLLAVLGEVTGEFKELLDGTVVAALSHSSVHVRVEAALTLRVLSEVDPTCVGGLISYGITTLYALRESVHFGKGDLLRFELDSLHGQAALLAAIVSTSRRLLLGYPARLPISVLEVSKKMLVHFSRNPVVACVQKQAGWLLLGSLIESMPKEELEDQVFDVLLLWTDSLGRHPGSQTQESELLISEISVMSAAIESIASFIRSFISSTTAAINKTVLLQPVLFYLSGALSYITSLEPKQLENIKPASDLFTIRTLAAYQSLSDPILYKGDHAKIIQICTSPFRDPYAYEESSCLRLLLDRKDSCLGPWTPGRDWFEDELRAFDGGTDGLLPCLWESQISTFPQPDTVSKMLVNQMLLCFGCMFAAQDDSGKLMLLNIIDQCLKSGRKQPWHAHSVTNACVALLSGLKALIVSRPQHLDFEILSMTNSIFLGILSEGEICSSQRRASSEGLGLLGRLGSDAFTARMARSILGDLATTTDPFYIGSLAVSLGCIHRSAGGMALSSLVPSTVSSVSSLARSPNATLQQWSLHALLLTIEAAGLSYMPHVQATLSLAMEILLSEESGRVNIRQAIGRLINAIVAVIGPELSPQSTFFFRCKSVIAEISSGLETSTLVECVRFTQQLVLFAPQAVSVHSHVQTLLPTLSSKQPTLRQLAVSTLKHLIETDPVAVIDENIEERLFVMLDDETDSEIGNLVRETIRRMFNVSCPSHPSRWLVLCRNMALGASSLKIVTPNSSTGGVSFSGGLDGDPKLYYNDDDENMIANSVPEHLQGPASASQSELRIDKHLRHRTRIFAAECLSHLPTTVGTDPAHFDLSLARKRHKDHACTGDWLVLNLQELVSLAYQISTSQFEGIQPVGLQLLISIMDKFEKTPDPELPDHFMLEQYQAQLVSAIRSSVALSSSPLLLEAGLQLAQKVLTSDVLRGDQVALQRMFSLISHPLNDFKDLYYPSFAEWVACKIKIRLLAAHASIRCHVYKFLQLNGTLSEDYHQLLPMFSERSKFLGSCWISILRDYFYIKCGLQSKSGYKPFLDGIQSLLVSSKVLECLDKDWTSFLLATVTDAIPDTSEMQKLPQCENDDVVKASLMSGCSMVRLNVKEFHFLWGLALLALFQNQCTECTQIRALFCHGTVVGPSETAPKEMKNVHLYEVPLLVFISISTKIFFCQDYLTLDICQELLQVLVFAEPTSNSWDFFSITLFSQLILSCPGSYFEMDDFVCMATELCIKNFLRITKSSNYDLPQGKPCRKDVCLALFSGAEKIAFYLSQKNFWKLMVALLSSTYECIERVSNDALLSKFVGFLQNIYPVVTTWFTDNAKVGFVDALALLGSWSNLLCSLSHRCIKRLHHDTSSKYLSKKFAFFLEEIIYVAQLAYGLELCQKDSDKTLLCSLYKLCIKGIQDAIADTSEQVHAIGVHILKNLAQKKPIEGSAVKFEFFLLFFIGELLEDVIMLAQRKLRGRLGWGGVATLEDCLRLLFIFHSISSENECFQHAIAVLLEAILSVFSAFNDLPSKELSQVKNVATVLVSHLVQTPSSAIQIKEILLSMPVIERQQFQDIIRSSATPSQTQLHMKPVNLPLPIKLPVQHEVKQLSGMLSHEKPTDRKENDHSGGTDKIDEDDDWDSFQSFPASTDADMNLDRSDLGPDFTNDPSMQESVQNSDRTHTSDHNMPSVEAQMKFDDQSVDDAEGPTLVRDDDDDVFAGSLLNEKINAGESVITLVKNGNEAENLSEATFDIERTPQDGSDDAAESELSRFGIVVGDLSDHNGSLVSSLQSEKLQPGCEGTSTGPNDRDDASKIAQPSGSAGDFTEGSPVSSETSRSLVDNQNYIGKPSGPPSEEDEVY